MRLKNDGENMREKKLVVIDDFFPSIVSNFRITEFNYYMSMFPNCEVYSALIGAGFLSAYNEYVRIYPQFAGRVKQFNPYVMPKCSLFYTMFLNSAYFLVPYFERENTPFLFTLYPGGGLHLNDAVCDNKLRRIFSSNVFKSVIVTQEIVYRHIVDNKLISPDKIDYIYGIVDDSEYFRVNTQRKKQYGRDKSTFDICFVGGKYSERGVDKGYDTFIEVCKRLKNISDKFRFHVVGGFNRGDIDVSALGGNITFYGYKAKDFFVSFYPGMDIILSPNIPFARLDGEFDGFPTGCCVQAALCGTAVFSTDLLNLNRDFVDRKEIVIVKRNLDDIVSKIIYYATNMKELYTLSENGRSKFMKVFDTTNQINRRIQVLKRYL
ncbi:glycosyltransferase family 4 protein [Clostridium sp. DMHC 10]|uniref:glycosyltransferase family 4 protein n=1 Tax=Clostridium sp. DMHC 10 TaxID=747377 RepID=UPI001FA76B19|nr:glycosyltransferase family 4 protein [Clostridium sp. DMHC 10]